MYNENYYLEISILSSILYAHHQCKDEQFFHEVELKEEYFTNGFNKLVARQINENRDNNKPIFEEFIFEELIKKRLIHDQIWNDIMRANPFGRRLFELYFESIKSVNKEKIGAI